MRLCRLIAGAAVVALCAAMPAHAQAKKPRPDGGYNVGFVTASVGLTFYQAMKCAAEATAKDHGVNLIWQGSQSISPRDELQVLQAVASQSPDGILLVPWDSTAFIAPTKELIDAGTPVITVDGSLTEPVDIQNIRTSNLEAGKQAAHDLAKMIGAKGSVLILTASPGNAVQNERWAGFKEVLDKEYPDVHLLDVQYIESNASKAASVTASVLTANPDLAAIYATQDAGAEGAANALRSAGKRGEVKVVGYDATERQVELLKAGDLDALVAQSPRQLGKIMVESMVKVLEEGREAANLPYQVFTPVKFLTRDNIEDDDSKGYIYSPNCE
ncbi:MAG: substrate-binding domain-containing protein [Afipia sp.]|nr:substrate-binding domain-containing protein [Afipia sp.]